MNIIAIIGSPKKNGYTSLIVDEIIKGAEESKHECKKIYISNLNIKDCTGCMKCQKNEKCIIRDDIEIIENAIVNNDIIIWATPTRFGNVSGYMLKVFERLFGFLIEERKKAMPLKKNANGKKAILITSCSTSWPFNYIFNQSKSCLDRIREVTYYSGQKIIKKITLPGTIDMNIIPEKYLIKARKIGKSIK